MANAPQNPDKLTRSKHALQPVSAVAPIASLSLSLSLRAVLQNKTARPRDEQSLLINIALKYGESVRAPDRDLPGRAAAARRAKRRRRLGDARRRVAQTQGVPSAHGGASAEGCDESL
jgi:hypothetical protein